MDTSKIRTGTVVKVHGGRTLTSEPEGDVECRSCHGSGVIRETWNAGDGITTSYDPCDCPAGEQFAARRLAETVRRYGDV